MRKIRSVVGIIVVTLLICAAPMLKPAMAISKNDVPNGYQLPTGTFEAKRFETLLGITDKDGVYHNNYYGVTIETPKGFADASSFEKIDIMRDFRETPGSYKEEIVLYSASKPSHNQYNDEWEIFITATDARFYSYAGQEEFLLNSYQQDYIRILAEEGRTVFLASEDTASRKIGGFDFFYRSFGIEEYSEYRIMACVGTVGYYDFTIQFISVGENFESDMEMMIDSIQFKDVSKKTNRAIIDQWKMNLA